MNETSLCKFIGIEPKRFLVFRRNKVQKSLINRILSIVDKACQQRHQGNKQSYLPVYF